MRMNIGYNISEMGSSGSLQEIRVVTIGRMIENNASHCLTLSESAGHLKIFHTRKL